MIYAAIDLNAAFLILNAVVSTYSVSSKAQNAAGSDYEYRAKDS